MLLMAIDHSVVMSFSVIFLLSLLSFISGYDPEKENVYYLFTRESPERNETLTYKNASQVLETSFSPSRRTVITIHGWLHSITSEDNSVLISACLAAEDVNVIGVDWSAGAEVLNYIEAVNNAVASGTAVATFISWLNGITGANVSQYHILGHSLGGQQAGVIGRNLGGQVPYITGLDAAGPGFEFNKNRFKRTDGLYTEVLHTNAGGLGYVEPLGDVDFYFNGGTDQPGCAGNSSCDHARSFLYFAESITSGGFTAVKCTSYLNARTGTCTLPQKLKVGGIFPEVGTTGVYALKTNSKSPYSIS